MNGRKSGLGGQSTIALFREVFEVTASLRPSINRDGGRAFEGAEHLGSLVSLCESDWEPSNSLVIEQIISAK